MHSDSLMFLDEIVRQGLYVIFLVYVLILLKILEFFLKRIVKRVGKYRRSIGFPLGFHWVFVGFPVDVYGVSQSNEGRTVGLS